MRPSLVVRCLAGCVFASILLTASERAAAEPSPAAVTTCSRGESDDKATLSEIDTGNVMMEADHERGSRQILFNREGVRLGYAERQGHAGIVHNSNFVPLISAKRLENETATPSEFSPLLADWSIVFDGSYSYLCVNFNFDGIGRSGSFQKAHGLYLLRLNPGDKSQPSLYYSVFLDN